MTFPATDEDGFGPDDVRSLTGVSRETLDRVQAFIHLLDIWRTRINLIGPGEGRRLWRRHVLDSLQLVPLLADDDLALADLGTGAGFPGVLLAAHLSDRPGADVVLFEKSVRKSEFLNSVIDKLRLPARVLSIRIEDAPPVGPKVGFDVVTARALAPLPKLVGYAHGLLKPSGKALLLKGREAGTELTLARESWTYHLSQRASLSSPDGQVLSLSSLAPLSR